MPRFAANLSMLFTDLAFLDRFEAAADAGFRGVEFLFPYDWPVGEIKRRLEDNGLELVLFNLRPGDWDSGKRGLTAATGRELEFEDALHEALDYAAALACPRLHAMAGLTTYKGGCDRATYIKNLENAAKCARGHSIEILIEPINTRDMPGYFLNTTEDARDIIEDVGASNLKLQFDLYHRHIMEGGVERAIADFADITAHYQVAGPPDRGEPHPSDLGFKPLFEQIDRLGFQGWIGCEYKPRGDTSDGFKWFDACGVSPNAG